MKSIHPPRMVEPRVSAERADGLLAWLRDYSERRIDAKLFDERRCVPPHVILDLGNRGAFGLQVPEEFDGLALRNRDFLRVLEQFGAIDLSLASLIFIHNANGVRPLAGFASPAKQAELLPLLARGRELAAFALTEPAAGSDVPGIETIAAPGPRGGWRIRGVKRWNGSGWAGVITVFAKMLDAAGKPRHISAFVVRQGAPGLHVGPESLTMGVRSIMQNAIEFHDVPVEPADLVGELGKGMEVADEALLAARLCMGALCLGAMKRCVQLMHRYASRRRVSTGRLLDSPITLASLGELTVRIALTRALVDELVAVMDRGDDPADEACMVAKIYATDSLGIAADALVQLLGGRGYMENNMAARLFRDCRMLRIGEGANELMTLSVGRRAAHSQGLHAFLSIDLGAPEVAERLGRIAPAIEERCLAAEGPRARRDRGAAMAWAHTLIGRCAIQGVVLAAARRAARRAATAALERAAHWAEHQFESTARSALEGGPFESLLITASEARDFVDEYVEAIGDLEPPPPNVEEAVDPLLLREPTAAAERERRGRLPGDPVILDDAHDKRPGPSSRGPRMPGPAAPAERGPREGHASGPSTSASPQP